MNTSEFFDKFRKKPESFTIVHYSSASLFDADHDGYSPRITSIAVRHCGAAQTISYSMHLVAEYLKIERDEIESRYDDIERELLDQFFACVREYREQYWVHWNMDTVTYGFQHLEHRYRILTGEAAATVPVNSRINLNNVLRDRYGDDYAGHPRMQALMMLNGEKVQGFLSGKEEADAFKSKDYIRMHASTISKVQLFHHFLVNAVKGKLKTAGHKLANRIDRHLESRKARVFLFLCAIVGIGMNFIQGGLWLLKR